MKVISRRKTASLKLLLGGWLFCFTLSLHWSDSDLFQISVSYFLGILNLEIFFSLFSVLHIQIQHILSYAGKPENIIRSEAKKGKVQSYCAHRCGVTEVGQIPALSQKVCHGPGEQTRAGIRLEST